MRREATLGTAVCYLSRTSDQSQRRHHLLSPQG
jgi:hypothetical protein